MSFVFPAEFVDYPFSIIGVSGVESSENELIKFQVKSISTLSDYS